MNTVDSTAGSSTGHEVLVAKTLPATPCVSMFEPIRGLDPDFGGGSPRAKKSASWWAWFQPGKTHG